MKRVTNNQNCFSATTEQAGEAEISALFTVGPSALPTEY